MADSGETTFVFKANTKPAEDSLDAFGDKVISVGKGIGASLAVYFTFDKLKEGLEKAVHAAIESDQAIRAFSSSLALSGKYSEEAAAKFESFATKLERTTGVQDEIILKNASLLVSLGKLSGDGLERATKASLDLAKGMGVDTGTAFDIVTKAANGNVMALSKWGLHVDARDTEAQKFAKTLQFIETRFGGLSSGNINTFDGALKKVSNGFDDVFESAGKFLTHDKKLIALLIVIADKFYEVSDSISEIKTGVDSVVDVIMKIGSVVNTWLIAPLEVMARVATASFLLLPSLALQAYTKVAGYADSIFGTDLQSKILPLQEMVTGLQEAAIAPLVTDDQLLTTRIGKSIDETSLKVDELASKLKDDIPRNNAIGLEQTKTAWDLFKSGFTMTAKELEGTWVSLGKSIKNTLVNGLASSFKAVGEAIVRGDNLASAFGKALLGAVAEVAMQMSAFYIAWGIAEIAGFNYAKGASLIAAGAGFAIVGGAISAFASSIGGGGSSGSTASSGSSIGGGGTSDFGSQIGGTQVAEQERAQAQTGVQVVVQGNIFDSRDTGLQIAQIINDSFDLNGTIIRANA